MSTRRMSDRSKANGETKSNNPSGFETSEEIVFTSVDELSEYNKRLLNGFVTYLNDKHKKTRNVFHCGARV